MFSFVHFTIYPPSLMLCVSIAISLTASATSADRSYNELMRMHHLYNNNFKKILLWDIDMTMKYTIT